MVRKLDELTSNRGVWDSPWDQPAAKIAWLREALAREREPQKRFDLQREIAETFLIAGSSELAIATLEAIARELGPVIDAAHAELVQADLALAFFRMGELQNCAMEPQLRLLPLPGAGRAAVHQSRLACPKR
jgi:hypothetical protein